MRKQLNYIMAIAMLLCVSACGGAEKNPSKPLPIVAIATLMSHPALDQVREGVIEGLAEQGFQQGKDYVLVDRNANGQTQVAVTIAGELAAQKPAVIVAIATPMAQAVKARWQGPLVFAAVTDPVGAGLVSSLQGGGVITGTSDAWPYQDQLQLIRDIQPGARRLAVLFNPGEAASQFGMTQIHKFAPSLGFEIIEAPVNSTGEVAAAARLAGGRADALFLSSDNTVISAVGAAFQEAVKLRKRSMSATAVPSNAGEWLPCRWATRLWASRPASSPPARYAASAINRSSSRAAPKSISIAGLQS